MPLAGKQGEGTGQQEEAPTKPKALATERLPNNRLVIWCMTVGTVVLIAALLTSLVNLWPTVDAATKSSGSAGSPAPAASGATVRMLFGLLPVNVTGSTSLLLLVIIGGALGSLVQTATSFGDFVGNRRFFSSWVPWYVMRILAGVLLALLFYFVFRGGFFSGNAPTSAVNPYGTAALAGLAGLFSKQATDKLREVFETLFHVAANTGDAQRKDDLANPVPTLTAVRPPSLTVGSAERTLTIRGTNFVEHVTVVRADGVEQDTTFVSPQELSATLSADLVATSGSLQITAFNGPPGGGESKPPVVVTIAPPVGGTPTAVDTTATAPGSPDPTPENTPDQQTDGQE